MNLGELVNKNIYFQTRSAYQTIAKNTQALAGQEGIKTKKPVYKLSFYNHKNTYFSLEVRTQQDDVLLRVEGQIQEEALPVVIILLRGPANVLTQKIGEYTRAFLQEQKEVLGIEYVF